MLGLVGRDRTGPWTWFYTKTAHSSQQVIGYVCVCVCVGALSSSVYKKDGLCWAEVIFNCRLLVLLADPEVTVGLRLLDSSSHPLEQLLLLRLSSAAY